MYCAVQGGAHPGMRAAAEMKKTAAAQQSTTGSKGMMGVILPMYAVGIVIYLIYTLTKVRTSSTWLSFEYFFLHFSHCL